MAKPTCKWVVSSGVPCGESVRAHWKRDDDQNRRKYYDPFCPEHQARFEAEDDDE